MGGGSGAGIGLLPGHGVGKTRSALCWRGICGSDGGCTWYNGERGLS